MRRTAPNPNPCYPLIRAASYSQVAERLVASRTRAGSVVHELLLTGVALVGETLTLEQGAPDYPETFGHAVGGSVVHGDQLNVYYELKLAFTERLKSADSVAHPILLEIV
jgi:hypothetical protein